jgi:hypothetical protein
LDPEDAVTDYLACLRQEQVDSHAGWDREKPAGPTVVKASTPVPVPIEAKPAVKPAAKPPAPVTNEIELPELQLPRAEHVRPGKKEYLERPSAGTPWTAIAIVAAVVIASAFLWMRHTRTSRGTVAKAAPAVTAAAATQAQAQTSSSTAPPVVAAAAAEHSTAAPVQPAASRTSAPAADTATDASQVKVEHKGDVTIRSFGTAAAKPAEKGAATLTLVIRASESSWISVTSDGQLVTQETLIAPAATSFHATREFVVRVGNAAGVSFLWNGQELAPQGAESEAKTLIFDAQGMRALASDPNSN